MYPKGREAYKHWPLLELVDLDDSEEAIHMWFPMNRNSWLGQFAENNPIICLITNINIKNVWFYGFFLANLNYKIKDLQRIKEIFFLSFIIIIMVIIIC